MSHKNAPFSAVVLIAAQVRIAMDAGSSIEKALDTVLAKHDPELKSAVQSLTYTTMRHLIVCTSIVRALVARPPKNPVVSAVILIAIAHLLDSPEKSYVICNETVNAIKSDRRTASSAGLVNACVRRFCREREELLKKYGSGLSARLNTPQWWIKKISSVVGKERAVEVLQLQQSRPPLVLRVNSRLTTPEKWCAAALEQGIEARLLGDDAVIMDRPMPVDRIPGFNEGLVSVQDAGAQLAAKFLAPKDGEHILDACAAPGGKTAHILEKADAVVTAMDVSPERGQRIKSNLDRLGLTARLIYCDAGNVSEWWDGRQFDSILLDAPCTGGGVVRRRPDTIFLRRPEDIGSLALQQKRLLEELWPLVKVGGKLLYAVCSIFEEEGVRQISDFVQRHEDAEPTPLCEGLPPMLTLIPCENSDREPAGIPDTHDGFFYALITKK